MKAKGETEPAIDWDTVDVFKDVERFQSARSEKKCPADESLMQEVRYDGTDMSVEVCIQCKGIWLDADEYEKIVKALPEDSAHAGSALRLLEYRIASRWPMLEDAFRALWYAAP